MRGFETEGKSRRGIVHMERQDREEKSVLSGYLGGVERSQSLRGSEGEKRALGTLFPHEDGK